MSRFNSYRDGAVHVMAEKCETCIFRPGNLMHLADGRLEDLVEEALMDDSAITCHKTLPYGTGAPRDQAVCRGFYDVHKRDVAPLRLASMLGLIVEDPV